MTPIDWLILVVLAVALLDKLFDLDHECWRTGCAECEAARVRQRNELPR
jgi:hypothetical protein